MAPSPSSQPKTSLIVCQGFDKVSWNMCLPWSLWTPAHEPRWLYISPPTPCQPPSVEFAASVTVLGISVSTFLVIFTVF